MTKGVGSAILTVDIDRARARATLIAPVEGTHRLIADATTLSSNGQTSDSVRTVIDELQQLSGWRLLRGDGSVDPDNVRAVAFSDGAGRPRRLVILAGKESAVAVVASRISGFPNAEIVLTGSLEGRPADRKPPLQSLANHLHGLEADVIIVDAGDSASATAIGAVVSASHLISARDTIAVLYAGDTMVAETLREQLSAEFALQHISGSAWDARDFRVQDLQSAWQSLADGEGQNGPAPEGIFDGVPTIAASFRGTAYDGVIRLLAASARSSVCIVDVRDGSRCVVAVSEGQEGEDGSRRAPQHSASVGASSGGLDEILRQQDLESVSQWLPFDIEDDVLRDYLGNRRLRPWLMPRDARDLLVDQAVARACARRSQLAEVRSEFLIATGCLSSFPRLGQVILTLLDIAQPLNPCRLLVDRADLLLPLGHLFRIQAESALTVLRSDTLVNAGSCLSLLGKAKQGETVAEISVRRSSALNEESTEKDEMHEVRYGTVTVIPLSSREQASIRVATGRRFSFGIESSQKTWTEGSAEMALNAGEGIAGGVLGLIIDARGRPLELTPDRLRRQALMSDWLRSLDAYDAELFSGLD